MKRLSPFLAMIIINFNLQIYAKKLKPRKNMIFSTFSDSLFQVQKKHTLKVTEKGGEAGTFHRGVAEEGVEPCLIHRGKILIGEGKKSVTGGKIIDGGRRGVTIERACLEALVAAKHAVPK